MAKKKHYDHNSVEEVTETAASSAIALPVGTEAVESPSEATASTLSPVQDSVSVERPRIMDRVQAFLALRTELAANLAAEIEATEKKLADLRKTAAMLFPENAAVPVTKDKKPKKPAKPKVVSRTDDQTSETTEQEAA